MSQEMIQLWVYNQGGAPHVAKCRPYLSLLMFTPVCAAGAVPRVGSCSGDCNLLAINLVNSKFVK